MIHDSGIKKYFEFVSELMKTVSEALTQEQLKNNIDAAE